MERDQQQTAQAAAAAPVAASPASAHALPPEVTVQIGALGLGDAVGLAHLIGQYPGHTLPIIAAVASRLGNATVQRAIALARQLEGGGAPTEAPSPDAAPKVKSPGPVAELESLGGRLIHGSQEAQVAALSPAQRADYDAILAHNAQSDHPIDPADALAKAKQGRPLTNDDRAAVVAVQQKMASLKVNSIDDHDPNEVQIEISFDGTWNDRDEMAFQTNPALINELFDGPAENRIYEVGIGTSADTKVVGGATGLGFHDRIKNAYTTLVQRINDIKSANPAAQVVLVISGFSRGSAAARAFANELDRLGIPDLSSPQNADGSHTRKLDAPRIGVMMLFDTVASLGLAGDDRNHNLDGSNVDLSIPANAENVLHLTARDEKRAAFPLSSAVDPSRDDPRINELPLPGAHSDIGGGYPNAYSGVSLDLALEYFQKTGVHMKPNPRAPVDIDDPALRLHESRSSAEMLFEGPDHKRKVFGSSNPR